MRDDIFEIVRRIREHADQRATETYREAEDDRARHGYNDDAWNVGRCAAFEEMVMFIDEIIAERDRGADV